MSQRVNRKNRQEELIKKQKQQKMIAIILVIVVVIACVAAIIYAVISTKNGNKDEQEKASSTNQVTQLDDEQLKEIQSTTDGKTVYVDPILEYLSTIDTEMLNEEILPEVEETTSEAVSE